MHKTITDANHLPVCQYSILSPMQPCYLNHSLVIDADSQTLPAAIILTLIYDNRLWK
ncbi:hypothetical protein [Traorella massiliensis]|uniref:hypothetical protein n=1 Tax=Traorella massiliensis TaxID=1903263 RepID=UPI00248D4606|nr:hypothetical protein [Traorella massiliensis]